MDEPDTPPPPPRNTFVVTYDLDAELWQGRRRLQYLTSNLSMCRLLCWSHQLQNLTLKDFHWLLDKPLGLSHLLKMLLWGHSSLLSQKWLVQLILQRSAQEDIPSLWTLAKCIMYNNFWTLLTQISKKIIFKNGLKCFCILITCISPTAFHSRTHLWRITNGVVIRINHGFNSKNTRHDCLIRNWNKRWSQYYNYNNNDMK